jgi:hypothetical protein
MRNIFISLLLLANNAICQNVLTADAAATQLLTYRNSDGFYGCGLRSIVDVNMSNGRHEVYDFSIQTYKDMKAIVKVGIFSGTEKEILSKKSKTLSPPDRFWIDRPQTSKINIYNYKLNSGTHGFSIFMADYDQVSDIFEAMISGDRLQFSAIYESDETHKIVSFRASVSKQDAEDLTICYNTLQ